VSTTARAAGPARRIWLASPAVVLAVLGGFALALIAAVWPLASLARLSVTASTDGPPWEFAAIGLVGFVIAWRKPGNALGWCLAGSTVATLLSDDGSLYAIAAYRIRHGTLPLGWVAMLAQPGWAIAIVLVGVAVLIFPDGRPASPLLRWVLWLYLAPALVWMVSAYALTLEAIIRHAIRVDSGGNLVALDNGSNSPAWWNVLQYATFIAIGLGSLLVLAGQVASFRRATGERRQQLKWLLGGFSAVLVGAVTAIATGGKHGGWEVVSYVTAVLAIFALPVSMGVAILKYRLYDIDRIISRTLAYAIITGLLVGVYAGLVLLATDVLSVHTPVAVAAATLAAAALFSPLRRRVQQVMDRRFNRARYDADQTVAAFAARLKDGVDLGAVRDDLAGIVNQALEPAHISIWISHRG
jgi:hypothetical protein